MNEQNQAINPFALRAPKLERVYDDWHKLYAKPYDKDNTDPYTKCRVILTNGAEFEAVKHSNAIFRTIDNNDVRRALAAVRRSEQQQQKRIACLKPINESTLEHTISYEQLAVDLTASMAQAEPDKYVVKALNFALLEDFDHLYRYSNLLEMTQGVRAETIVGNYTEIMPARPTIAHHRHPYDTVKRHTDGSKAALISKLHTAIITAAEQQTMNYYMNVCAFAGNLTGLATRPNVLTDYGTGRRAKEYADLARRLYQEIAMVEEDHVTQYGSLIDTQLSPLRCNLMHEYTECYLYYSCYASETHPDIKRIWEWHFNQELAHLAAAEQLLRQYEHVDHTAVLGEGDFPQLLFLHENVDYVRKVLRTTVNKTDNREDWCDVAELSDTSDYFAYQRTVNKQVDKQASHQVVLAHVAAFGSDYRHERAANPLAALRDRKTDNVDLGTQRAKPVLT